MKHEPDVASARCLSRHDRRQPRPVRFPRIDWEFQPRRRGDFFDGSDSPRRRPGFSLLAREVLRSDASCSFRLEAAVLGFVSLVCAWPLAVMIHEVYLLLK